MMSDSLQTLDIEAGGGQRGLDDLADLINAFVGVPSSNRGIYPR